MSLRARAAMALFFSFHGLGGLAFGQATPTDAEQFFRPPAIEGVQVSPSGQRLAMLVRTPEGRTGLAVTDLPMKAPPRIIAAYSDGDITRVDWVSDSRLAYDVFNLREGSTIWENHAGTFAVDHDGNRSRLLIAWRYSNDSTSSRIVSRVLTYPWKWTGAARDGSDDIWVYEARYDNRENWIGNDVARLNTVDGKLRRPKINVPPHTSSWTSNSAGEVTVAQTLREGRAKLHVRPADGEAWSVLQDEDYLQGHHYSPLFLEADGQLVVIARPNGAEAALYGYRTATRQLSPEPLVAVKGYDLDPTLEVDTKSRRVVGVHFRADRPLSHWFDPELAGIQAGLDAALPSRFNRLICGYCESTRFIAVHSTSDRHPGEYFLFDRQERKLERIGTARPWLDEARQGRRTFHRVTTRDGLAMPVYITHPPGSKPNDPLPAVVLVHGGPWLRGADLSWVEEAQFLASRGYRVIEPEFRGSVGYGAALYQAGIKQWGRAMQDDLIDAVQWAAKQGLVDDQRVCVMGSSYGGYAALMGPIRHAGAYRCAISFAGVTDIVLRYEAWGSDLSEDTRKFILPQMMGGPDDNEAWLREVSPLHRAKDIKVPVLLAHGAQDRRVPLEHARKFEAAAKEAGVDLTYVVYDRIGHGWVRPSDQIDFYKRVDAFLAQHLSTSPAKRQ